MASPSDEILIVTVATPNYRHLLRQMRGGIKRNLLPAGKLTVIKSPSKQGFVTKLALDKLLPRRRIVFMDADTRLLRPFDLSNWNGDWLAVPDPSAFLPHTFPMQDCETHGLPKPGYWNSGFFACDLRRPEHRAVFSRARHSLKQLRAGKISAVDWTDQVHFNRATHAMGLPITLLPFSHNFYPHVVTHGGRESYPRNIVLAHAAGYALKEKAGALDAMEMVFGTDHREIEHDVVRHIHNITQEWR